MTTTGSRELRPHVAREAFDVGEDRALLLHRVIEDEVRHAERLVSPDVGGDLVRGALERRPVAGGRIAIGCQPSPMVPARRSAAPV